MKLFTKVDDKMWVEWDAEDMRNSDIGFFDLILMVLYWAVLFVVGSAVFCLLCAVAIWILNLF